MLQFMHKFWEKIAINVSQLMHKTGGGNEQALTPPENFENGLYPPPLKIPRMVYTLPKNLENGLYPP